MQVVLAWPSPDWNERAGDSGRGCSSAQDWVRMQDPLDGTDTVAFVAAQPRGSQRSLFACVLCDASNVMPLCAET